MSKQSVITYNLNEGTSTEYTHGIIYNSLSAALLNSIKCIVLGMSHGNYIYLMYNIRYNFYRHMIITSLKKEHLCIFRAYLLNVETRFRKIGSHTYILITLIPENTSFKVLIL